MDAVTILQIAQLVILPIGFAVLTVIVNTKFKRMEIQQKERDREFLIKGPWIQRSLEVLAKSNYYVNQLTIAVSACSVTGAEGVERFRKAYLEAMAYWDENSIFLPPELRRNIQQFTVTMHRFGIPPDGSLPAEAATFATGAEMLKKINTAIDSIAKRYGVYDGYDA